MKLKPVKPFEKISPFSQERLLSTFTRVVSENARVLSFVLAGLVLLLAILFGKAFLDKSREEKFASLYISSNRPTDLQKIVEESPSSPIAPLALYTLAVQFQDSQKWEEAQKLFQLFVENYSAHFLSPQAKLSLAYSTEKVGELGQARTLYRELRLNPVARQVYASEISEGLKRTQSALK